MYCMHFCVFFFYFFECQKWSQFNVYTYTCVYIKGHEKGTKWEFSCFPCRLISCVTSSYCPLWHLTAKCNLVEDENGKKRNKGEEEDARSYYRKKVHKCDAMKAGRMKRRDIRHCIREIKRHRNVRFRSFMLSVLVMTRRQCGHFLHCVARLIRLNILKLPTCCAPDST